MRPSSYCSTRGRAYVCALLSAVSLILAASLIGCGGTNANTSTTQSSGKTLRSISITPGNATVTLGSSAQFWATGNYSDGSKADITSVVSWNTSQPSVAVVSAPGMIASKSVGTTSVNAVMGAVSASQSLTVTAAALVSVSVGPQNLSLRPGVSVQLTATGTYSDGSHQDLTSSAAWTSSAIAVAAVGPTGVATAVTGGSTTITATSGSVSGNDLLSVASLVSIAVTPSAPTVPLGEQQQLSATGTFSDGSTQDLTSSATWSSSAAGTVPVSATGLVSALMQGTATVTAQSGSIAGSDIVTVGPPALVSINVLPANSTLAVGTTEQFSASGVYSDGSTKDVTSIVTWGSADSTIATITTGGTAYAAQVGNTSITATSGSASGSAELVVDPLLAVTYFSGANTSGLTADGTVRIDNPGVTGGNLCAMVYVFDSNQEMSECCGCQVTPDGLLTLSVNTDLTANPLTGSVLQTGVIEVVPADYASNPTCSPAAITPSGLVATWATHVQSFGGNTFTETEDSFQRTPLSQTQLSTLQSDCTFVGVLGSGHGVCTCGYGD